MTGDVTLGFLRRMLANVGFPSFTFNGSTSGTTKLQSSAVASGTLTLPAATDTLVGKATTDTLTNKTISGGTVTGVIDNSMVRQSAQFDATSGSTGATLTNLTGMVETVVPGTYGFHINLPGIATANCGLKTAFKLTSTVLSAMEATSRAHTTAAVATQHTTTATDQAVITNSTTAIISTVIEGSFVVSTGGTMQLQAAQNVSHADTTSVYAGATMQFTRIT